MSAEELLFIYFLKYIREYTSRSGLTNCAAGIRPGRSAAVNIAVHDVYMSCKWELVRSRPEG